MEIGIDQQNRPRSFFGQCRREIQGRGGFSISGQGTGNKNALQFPGFPTLIQTHSQQPEFIRRRARRMGVKDQPRQIFNVDFFDMKLLRFGFQHTGVI